MESFSYLVVRLTMSLSSKLNFPKHFDNYRYNIYLSYQNTKNRVFLTFYFHKTVSVFDVMICERLMKLNSLPKDPIG